MKIFAIEICRHLNHLLSSKKEAKGSVHSVFNRVCNITLEDWPIISMILESIPMKPMALSFKSQEFTSIKDLRIKREQAVLYHDGGVEIPEADFFLSFQDAKIDDCSPLFNFDRGRRSDVEKNITELQKILRQGNPLGLLPVIYDFEEFIGEIGNVIPHNRYSQFAWPRICNLIKAIDEGELREISKAASEIAGFGPGLTPSADDMIIGLMVTLIYAAYYFGWPQEHVKAINDAILKGSNGKTTRLSYEMMGFAAKGEVIKNIHELLSCIYMGANNMLRTAAMAVMKYGETSGSDLLAGIYIGCKICGLNNAVKQQVPAFLYSKGGN